MRAVLDPNVVISGLLSAAGAPAQVLRAFEDGAFELIASDLLLDELERALAYPRLRRRIGEEDARATVQWLARAATMIADPTDPPAVRSEDPGDDYLIALAAAERCILVSGDRHLLDLVPRIPVLSPREFLALVADR